MFKRESSPKDLGVFTHESIGRDIFKYNTLNKRGKVHKLLVLLCAAQRIDKHGLEMRFCAVGTVYSQ